MGRPRVLSGREVCRILQQHGFAEFAIGTLLSIIRQSGIARTQFEE